MMQTDDGAGRAWATPWDKAHVVLLRGWRLLATEGPAGLLRGAWRFLSELRRYVYLDSRLRHYRLSIPAAVLLPVRAPAGDIRLRIVASREEALELARQGYDDLLSTVPGMERKLDAGAVAAFAFVGCRFASIDWMALSDRAKAAIDRTPCPASLADGEACTSGAYTVPRYRRRGIAVYRLSAEVQYLHSKGCHTCYSMIAAGNVPSQRCVERYGATVATVFHHRRLLGRDSYRRV